MRAVHSLIGGGSFRDVTRLLRDAREVLDDDEVAWLDADTAVPEPVKPSPGRIRDTLEAAKAADAEAGKAAAVLDERLEHLRDLQAHSPPPAVNADEGADSVSRRFEHEAQVATLVAEVNQLRGVTEMHMAEARALRSEAQKLQERARELRDYKIPYGRRDLAEARSALTIVEQEMAHRLRLAQRRIAIHERALTAYESELQALMGANTFR